MPEYPSGCTCEFTIVRFQRYFLTTLPLGESLLIAEHIQACVTCAQLLVLFERRERPAHLGR